MKQDLDAVGFTALSLALLLALFAVLHIATQREAELTADNAALRDALCDCYQTKGHDHD